MVLYKDPTLTVARGWTALTNPDSWYRSLLMMCHNSASPCCNRPRACNSSTTYLAWILQTSDGQWLPNWWMMQMVNMCSAQNTLASPIHYCKNSNNWTRCGDVALAPLSKICVTWLFCLRGDDFWYSPLLFPEGEISDYIARVPVIQVLTILLERTCFSCQSQSFLISPVEDSSFPFSAVCVEYCGR